mgnify:CR=1 FL=1
MIEQKLILQFKEINQKLLSIMQKKSHEYDLTFGLIYLLMVIMNKPNTTQKELAKEMRFTEGAMSISVKKLIKLKMVEQIQSQFDARCNTLAVTEKGRAVVEDYKHYLKGIFQDVFKGFNQNELEEMSELLMKMNGNLDQILMDISVRN